ncbi:LysR family transcriptional regulator [Parasedimentitalea huanghaiensis]|uniref:LysR family transcriptional regulator n=1 Tax=Parasedimentitalea huanghaiensis TaxID=2682100 RepID=A0A6L6WER9_9RHOB|nr:LysR family transcriptional regulator [Zongyanglinia huanghaiensis]MVO15768.1 LysR family transcriptional regulator [Zongyanglinia huanghaiensis]
MQDVDISQINGRVLRIFLAVFDNVSVSKAAHQLDISQSTVSHSIEKLRVILGDSLFIQAGRGIIPSAHAELMAPKVRGLLAEMEALVDMGDYNPHTDTEPFSIAANGSTLAHEVSRIRDAIWKQVPDKTVIFRELGSRTNVETVLDNASTNIAISVRPAKYPLSLNHTPLSSSKMVVFYDASVSEPVHTVSDYCNARHAALDFGGSSKSELALSLEDRGLKRRISCMVPNVWLLAEMVRGSDMIATLPSQLGQSAFSGLQSCPLPLPQADLHFDLVWHRRYDNSARLKWLRSVICDAIKSSD